jgi:hypothetical protein
MKLLGEIGGVGVSTSSFLIVVHDIREWLASQHGHITLWKIASASSWFWPPGTGLDPSKKGEISYLHLEYSSHDNFIYKSTAESTYWPISEQ